MDSLLFDVNNKLVEISTRQEVMARDLTEVKTAVLGSGENEPGIRLKVDRLERSEHTRARLLWLTITAFFTVIAERIYSWFTPKI